MSFSFIPENTQRALEKIKDYSSFLDTHGFYLAGGTALAFELKYRVSYDLDFFAINEFDSDELLVSFNQLELSNVSTEKGTLKFEFHNTSISFFSYPYKLLNNIKLIQGINIADMLDIALMKITAIANRGLEKDFSDLYYACQRLGGLGRILSRFREKYPDGNFEHYIKGLVYFEDAESGPRPNVIIDDYNWEAIKRYFEEEVASYLQGVL